MNMLFKLLVLGTIVTLASCNRPADTQEEKLSQPLTPVEVTSIQQGSVENQLTLFGSTVYLKRNVVTSPIPAFITDVRVKLGDRVKKGDVLYNLETKERRALGQLQLYEDTTLTSFGKIKVIASFFGIITTLDKQQLGDYVLEGTQLCTIAESGNLAVQINVPYEYISFTKPGKKCMIRLPDDRVIVATITTPLTTMNAAAQTQTLLARPDMEVFLPENLIVKVNLNTSERKNGMILPKEAVLTDEMMQEYWVMKLINDSTAVRQSVNIGKRNEMFIEIDSPVFNATDRIIRVGNYGLPDTALVSIISPVKK